LVCGIQFQVLWFQIMFFCFEISKHTSLVVTCFLWFIQVFFYWICVIYIFFSSLDSCIIKCKSYFDLHVSSIIQNSFIFCVRVLIAMNHCTHSHKSTWYIKLLFLLTKWCKIAPQTIKRRLFFCRFWKISPNLIYTSKKSSPQVNRFLVLSQVFLLDFLLFPWILDTFWDDGH
jgi:hypothetical protein